MFKKLNNIQIIKIVIACLLVALIGYNLLSNSFAKPFLETKVVEIETISLKDLTKTVQLTGTIKARNSAILAAQGDGILEILAPSGKRMKKGEVVAKIENKEAEKNYNLSVDAKEIAVTQFERAKVLLKSGAYSKNELEELKNKWILAQRNLTDARIALDKLVFYAPFDGIIGSYKVKQGQQLKIGDQIVSFFNPDSLSVDFDIPESVLALISDGQNLSIMGKNYKLNYVQKMLDNDKHMSLASVDIICDGCIIGSNIPVNLNVVEKKQVIVIPFDAVFLKNGKTCVYVVENNKTILKFIELGIREKDLVEVISGLAIGEVLINKNPNRLWPGLDIKIDESK